MFCVRNSGLRFPGVKRTVQPGDGRPHYWPHYWPRFCEENVWHLAGGEQFRARDAWVAVVTNPRRAVAMWFQRASELPGQPLLWDYHVIMFARTARGMVEVWDLDTLLGLPVPAEHYLAASFEAVETPDELRPRFRFMTASEYRDGFSSDRRHMKDEDGGWLAPPPPWAAIGRGHSLPSMLDLEATGPGQVLDLVGLRRQLEL